MHSNNKKIFLSFILLRAVRFSDIKSRHANSHLSQQKNLHIYVTKTKNVIYGIQHHLRHHCFLDKDFQRTLSIMFRVILILIIILMNDVVHPV